MTITGDYVWAERGAGGEPAKNAWPEFLEVIDAVRYSNSSEVTSIGDDAFANCRNMSYWYPGKVKTTGKCAFKNTQALNVVPFYWSASLTSIGDSAFYGCTPSNQEFISQAIVPPTLGKDVFNFNSSDGVTLFVLCASPFSDSLQLELSVQRETALLTKPNMEAMPATAG